MNYYDEPPIDERFESGYDTAQDEMKKKMQLVTIWRDSLDKDSVHFGDRGINKKDDAAWYNCYFTVDIYAVCEIFGSDLYDSIKSLKPGEPKDFYVYWEA